MDVDTLRRLARRHVRSLEDAEDVTQEVLLTAVRTGWRLDDPRFVAWASGAVRRQAAFMARSEGRRRRREQVQPAYPDRDPTPRFPDGFIQGLPDSLRLLAKLVNAGLSRGEIRYLLGITDTAFRQRLSALGLKWRSSGAVAEALSRDPERPLGLMRRALLKRLVREPGRSAGAHDPDGHLLIIAAGAHKSNRRGNLGS